MKKVLITVLLFVNSGIIFAQKEEREYIDTTFTTCFINACNEEVTIPKLISDYLLNSPSKMEIKLRYEGACIVRDSEYPCLRIHEAIITVRVYKSNNYKIKRDADND